MLKRECTVFCKYLIGQKPEDYIIEKYNKAHRSGSVNRDTDIKYFDNCLVWLAKITPLLTKLVDVYTCKLHKRSLVRRKFILLIAILESASPSCNHFDTVSVSSRTDLILKMCWKGGFFVISFLLSVVALMPLHLLFISMVSSHRNTHG